MSRSKKWRLEWSFFLGENGRRRYNKICKGCVHQMGRKTACGGFSGSGPYDFLCGPAPPI